MSLINDVEAGKENTNPLAPLEYLLELAGKNPYNYIYERGFKAMYDEFDNFSNMDEAEQRAYFAERKNAYLEKILESGKRTRDTEMVKHESIQKREKTRVAHGISEEQYAESAKSLVEFGGDANNPEEVVKHYKNSSAVDFAIKNLESFNVELAKDEGLIQQIATEKLMNPELTDDDINEVLSEILGTKDSDDDIEELNEKIDEVPSKTYKRPSPGKIESFDDFF